MRISFICIKYEGLNFNYPFKTNDFFFIPNSNQMNEQIEELNVEDFFSCRFDRNSSFYLLQNEPIDFDFTLKNLNDKNLYKFKFLEGLVALLFSNFIEITHIFILEKEKSEFKIKKIFKNISKDSKENNPILLWRNYIITENLKEWISKANKKLKSIETKDKNKVKEFSSKFYFCVDLYLNGKFQDNHLRRITNLWMSLEILSVITISNILHHNDRFELKANSNGNHFKKMKTIISNYANTIPLEEIDCWNEIKKDFPKHMEGKINNYLSVRQKIFSLAELYLKLENIKVELPERGDNTNENNFLGLSEFKRFQDKLTIKNIINKFYSYRNNLFHEGGLPNQRTIKFDRQKSLFIKLLEQLFFRILELKNITFYQIGYPKQKIWRTLGEEKKSNYFLNSSRFINNYIYQNLICASDIKSTNIFDKPIQNTKEFYLNKENDIKPLKDILNSKIKEISGFMQESHPITIIFDKNYNDNNLDFINIVDKKFSMSFSNKDNYWKLDNSIMNKESTLIKNRDKDNFNVSFKGSFDETSIRYGTDIIIEFLLQPHFILFEIN